MITSLRILSLTLRVIAERKLRQALPRATTIYNATFMDLGLKDRVALVAASSQGIGRSTAEAFAAEGCRVAICARNKETLEIAASKIRNEHRSEVFADALD